MNREDVIKRVSTISEVDTIDCKKVIDALEKVIGDEFNSSEGLVAAIDKFCKLIRIFKIKMI